MTGLLVAADFARTPSAFSHVTLSSAACTASEHSRMPGMPSRCFMASPHSRSQTLLCVTAMGRDLTHNMHHNGDTRTGRYLRRIHRGRRLFQDVDLTVADRPAHALSLELIQRLTNPHAHL